MNEKMSEILLQENRILTVSSKEWAMAPLYKQCLSALRQEDLQGIYVSWMMALVFIQSQGKAYFEADSALLRGRLNKMPFGTNAERRDWLRFIAVNQNHNAGKIPKFEYDSRVAYQFEHSEAANYGGKDEAMIASCRWGITQMPGTMFTLTDKVPQWLLDFRRFTACPDFQIRILARWIKKQQLNGDTTPERVFERFFYESGPTRKEPKVEVASALNFGFSEFIASRELVQCLYQSPVSES